MVMHANKAPGVFWDGEWGVSCSYNRVVECFKSMNARNGVFDAEDSVLKERPPNVPLALSLCNNFHYLHIMWLELVL